MVQYYNVVLAHKKKVVGDQKWTEINFVALITLLWQLSPAAQFWQLKAVLHDKNKHFHFALFSKGIYRNNQNYFCSIDC